MPTWKERRQAYTKARDEKRLAKLKTKIPEPTTLQEDYWKLAAQVGEKRFQVDCLEAEIRALCERMLSLSQLFEKSTVVHKPKTNVVPAAAQTTVDQVKEALKEPVASTPAEAPNASPSP